MEIQNQRLLEYMRNGNRVTPMSAFRDLGIFRLGARIYDLRQLGHPIIREMIPVMDRFGIQKHVAQYRLGK